MDGSGAGQPASSSTDIQLKIQGTLPALGLDYTDPDVSTEDYRWTGDAEREPGTYRLNGIPAKTKFVHNLPEKDASLPRKKKKDTSKKGLELIAVEFVAYLLNQPKGLGDLMEYCKGDKKLRRRVYDVTCTLDGLNLVTCSKEKVRNETVNTVQWKIFDGTLENARDRFQLRRDIKKLNAEEKEIDLHVQRAEALLRNMYSRMQSKNYATAADVLAVAASDAGGRKKKRGRSGNISRGGAKSSGATQKSFLVIHAPPSTVFERLEAEGKAKSKEYQLVARNVIVSSSDVLDGSSGVLGASSALANRLKVYTGSMSSESPDELIEKVLPPSLSKMMEAKIGKPTFPQRSVLLKRRRSAIKAVDTVSPLKCKLQRTSEEYAWQTTGGLPSQNTSPMPNLFPNMSRANSLTPLQRGNSLQPFVSPEPPAASRPSQAEEGAGSMELSFLPSSQPQFSQSSQLQFSQSSQSSQQQFSQSSQPQFSQSQVSDDGKGHFFAQGLSQLYEDGVGLSQVDDLTGTSQDTEEANLTFSQKYGEGGNADEDETKDRMDIGGFSQGSEFEMMSESQVENLQSQ